MRICLYTVTALPKLGGQEAVVDALAREFQALGHDVWVIAPRPRRSLKLAAAVTPYPVIRHPRFFSTTFGVAMYRWFLARAHRQHRFDVVHCHDTYPTGYLAALLQRRLRLPVVLTSHGGDIRPGNARLRKRGLRVRFERAIAAADAMVCIGAFTRAAFLKLGAPADRLIDIPNGVHLAPLQERVARPADLPATIQPNGYALFLGRLAERKGVDRLLDALATEPARDVRLVVAGSGPIESTLDAQIDRLRLRDRVHRVGRVDGDVKTYLLQNARFTVMPSREWEAFPLVVLESYAAGTPVLGTDIPGLAEWIQPGRTGWIAAGDTVENFAETLRLADSTTYEEMRQQCTNFAADFDWTEIARRHIELYQRVAKKFAARPAEASLSGPR